MKHAAPDCSVCIGYEFAAKNAAITENEKVRKVHAFIQCMT